MRQKLAQVSILVSDYDDAIDFYTNKLDFVLIEDTKLNEHKRWVRVAPPGSDGCGLLLAKASNERQMASIGNQTAGRVGFFLFTDDFWRDYKKMVDRGIKFVREPAKFEYGTVTVFEDLYGNKWDFIEPVDRS